MIAASSPHAESARGEFAYSNVGYNTMSVWFDDHHESGWTSVLDDRLFRPLAMSHTSARMTVADDQNWQVARPYSWKVDGGRQAIRLVKTDDTMHAAGGMVASAQDLSRFLIAQLNSGRLGETQVFPADVIRESQTVQVDRGNDRAGYAWGWFAREKLGRPVRFHTGGYPGASALLSFMPSERIGIAIVHNEGGLRANWLNSAIEDAVYRLMLGEQPSAVESNWMQRRADVLKRLSIAARERESARVARIARSQQLSLALDAYDGDYRHPLLGTLTVRVGADDLVTFQWGHLESVGHAGVGEGRFEVEFKPGEFEEVRFSTDAGETTAIAYREFQFDRVRQ